MDADVDQWVEDSAVWLAPTTYIAEPDQRERLAALDAAFDNVRVVFLGETNHFVHEKVEFRMWWLQRLARTRRLVIGEELGWADGRRVADYLADGDEAHINQAATFGYKAHRRGDRDDSPTGIFANSADTYPYDLMNAEHTRFYRALRELNAVDDFFGFDVDSPGGAYDDIARHRSALIEAGMPQDFWSKLARVEGESLDEEAGRLRKVIKGFHESPGFDLVREDLLSLVESLEYTSLFKDAADYEATRPAMAYREESMKRRLEDVLYRTPSDSLIVLLGHALHLAKDDAALEGSGVGPGGALVSSLGHYLVQDKGLAVSSVWMIYGAGEDSQPLSDLPRKASYPSDTLNAALLRYRKPAALTLRPSCPFDGPVSVGHLYNLVTQVQLCEQADAIMFFPTVSPLVRR